MAPLQVDRMGILKSFGLSATIAVAGVLNLRLRYGTDPKMTLLSFLALVPFFYRPLRLLWSGIAVECSTSGLTDHTTGLGFVGWNEIVGARHATHWFGDYVELELKNLNEVLERLSWLRAMMIRSNLKHGRPGPSINSGWVLGGSDAVLSMLGVGSPMSQS
jgi:hypothetical protein